MIQINEFYQEVRAASLSICSPLQIEDYQPQAAEFVSPIKWHLAHTTWFFEEMILKQSLKNYRPFHSSFTYLFNSYYNTIGERTTRANRGDITRPGVAEIKEYRSYVDQHMLTLLSEEISLEINELCFLGLNHEQQHQELMLTDVKYLLSLHPFYPIYKADNFEIHTINKPISWLPISEGIYTIGHDNKGFCFDNEKGRHRVFLEKFQIADRLVTNGEFLDFIDSGGYLDFKNWLDDGWHWIQNEKIQAPLYWRKLEGKWFEFTLSGLKPLVENQVLSHISYYEADAFARWKKCRLPTEFEWEVSSDQFQWGKRWEWTQSAYLPYPGFEIAEGAVGEYNGKFMINQMVLRGASIATPENHSRKTYRNFFQPLHRWQFTGIRLVKNNK